MTNTNLLALPSPRSQALKNSKYEKYCRLRALALPRTRAYREVGWRSKRDDVAYVNACRLERRPEIQGRIAWLTRQEEDVVVEKRQRIEEALWNIHEAAIGDYLETVEVDGKTIERPKRISDLPREIQQNIEKITISSNGRLVPQLYSKLAANQELRKMLAIGRSDDVVGVARLSDAELVAQLSDMAKQLGVEINLNYSFLQQQKPDDVPGNLKD
jgi:Terminase small subunit